MRKRLKPGDRVELIYDECAHEGTVVRPKGTRGRYTGAVDLTLPGRPWLYIVWDGADGAENVCPPEDIQCVEEEA